MHDFNAGIASSGLFWTIPVPQNALTIGAGTIRLQLQNVPIVDSFEFLGPKEIPATVSLDVTWTVAGPVRQLRPGSTDPTDPTNLAAEFQDAVATGTFSASENGFSIAGAAGSSKGGFAEAGHERNGFFLH